MFYCGHKTINTNKNVNIIINNHIHNKFYNTSMITSIAPVIVIKSVTNF